MLLVSQELCHYLLLIKLHFCIFVIDHNLDAISTMSLLNRASH